MKNSNLALRKAYMLALADIPYKGKNIPVYEEYVQPTAQRKIAKINIDATLSYDAYIILLNQTTNDDSSKCTRNDELSIQVQITTVFPLAKGGSVHPEEISEIVLGKLFTEDGLFKTIELPDPFGLWKGKLETVRNIPYQTDTNSVWVTQLVITNSVTQ